VTIRVCAFIISRMKYSRKEVGGIGEDVAARFLKGKGFNIVERNFRRPWGEINIIAEKEGLVRFVEVKTVSREMDPNISRETADPMPEELAHASKLDKVARTAQLYMESNRDNREFQLDVIAVYLNPVTMVAHCAFYEQVL